MLEDQVRGMKAWLPWMETGMVVVVPLLVTMEMLRGWALRTCCCGGLDGVAMRVVPGASWVGWVANWGWPLSACVS